MQGRVTEKAAWSGSLVRGTCGEWRKKDDRIEYSVGPDTAKGRGKGLDAGSRSWIRR